MKIGVLSDTHLQSVTPELKKIAEKVLGDTDLLVHAGDMVTWPVWEYFEARGTLAVSGNMDEGKLRNTLPQYQIKKMADFTLGLIHGWGSPLGLEKRIQDFFKDKPVDLVIYGHSHVPSKNRVGKTLYFNPGTVFGARLLGKRSVGMITLDQEITTEWIYL